MTCSFVPSTIRWLPRLSAALPCPQLRRQASVSKFNLALKIYGRATR